MIIPYPFEATEYTAEDVQTYLCTRTSGVYSDEITFTPEGMTVTVSPFLAWFNYAKFKGCSVAVTEPETLTFSPAHAVLDRIDRIALRVDFTVNKAYFTIIEGEPSSTPVPPNINKSETINDISPVYVKIKAGAAEITPADITSTILDESVCGIMRDGVTGIPTAQLQNQVMALLETLYSEISSVEDGSSYILKNGNTAMEADFDAGMFNVKNVADPIEDSDATNKKYVFENFPTKKQAHYVKDDTFSSVSLNILNGYVTDDGKVLYLSLPLSKPIDASSVTGAKITMLKGKVRGVNGYIGGSSEIDFVSSASDIWCKVFENAVSIKITNETAFSNAKNNTPVSVQIGSLVLKFT